MSLENKVKANQQPEKVEDLLRLNLQHFAEGDPPADPPAGDPTPTDPPSGGNNPTDPPAGEPDKTFSQEDVNNIATKEARKAQEKLFKELGIEDFDNAKEGMKQFKEWQDAQKTEAEKQTEKLTNLEKSHADVQSENQTLKAQVSAVKAGVNADSVEDVVTLAKNLVSDDVDMDAAIKKVMEKYPHFAGENQEQEEGKPSFSTGKHSKKPTTDAEQWLNAFK